MSALILPEEYPHSFLHVHLQEVEMGTGSVAFDAAMSVLNKAALEKGTTAGQWWADYALGLVPK